METADEGEKHATPAHLKNPLCAVTSSGVGWEGVLKLLYPVPSFERSSPHPSKHLRG